jgi:hypothetical protein
MFHYVVVVAGEGEEEEIKLQAKNYISNNSDTVSSVYMCMYQNIEGKIWLELKSRTEGNLYSIEALENFSFV